MFRMRRPKSYVKIIDLISSSVSAPQLRTESMHVQRSKRILSGVQRAAWAGGFVQGEGGAYLCSGSHVSSLVKVTEKDTRTR